ncbi:hypothetical protein, partial [Phascolarctobacterium succinatutens]|uniref:hypothetical protein n=1 Tax=Phascolarctobacterium succinatutens TaxID=626940 RepID=UPI002A811442
SLIGVIHFQGRFWDIKLQMNCLTLSWIRSMHLNFQKVCNFLLQFRKTPFLHEKAAVTMSVTAAASVSVYLYKYF